jgi:carbon storage regulator
MLILTRRNGETIRIEVAANQFITVTVLRSRTDGEVKLGITAPADFVVHREEVWERIQQGEPPPK